jgi:LuxR family transcriptional regulator, maltose regulon positive regulatory protein
MAHVRRDTLVKRMHGIINGSTFEIGIGERPSLYKLVLLHAPAGYGKTTLLADFARQTQFPCCWYSLDHTDTDRITFLTVLLMSIRQRFPEFGRELDPLLTGVASEHANNPENADYFDMIVDALVTAIEAEISDRFALLLCNYQEINEFQEMNTLISSLLQKLPRQCVLVIESRVIPTLDFARLLAGQMIFGIGIDQLRFTVQQIHELAQIQEVGPFTDTEAEQLVLAFDGWIAGILLGTRLSNLQQFQQSLTTPSFTDAPDRQAASQYLFSYVVNEVFKNHQEAYTFLKEACVLQEMPPVMCAALLNIPPSEASAHLHYLEQHNLFVTHSSEGPDIIYTCTPVLRMLFYEELRHESPERFSCLHQRAAELLSASHNYSQAIYHALEASVNDIAADLIIESAEQMMDQGHAETLARWIDAFPPATTNRYPQLLFIRANIYLKQGDHSLALNLINVADIAIQTLSSQASSLEVQHLPTLQAELAIARSRILFQQREYQRGLLLCQQALTSLPVDEVMLRAEAHMRLGLFHILLSDFTAGITQIQKSLQLWGRHTIRQQTADGHSALAYSYSLLGNFSLAEHHITRALACWDKLQDNWGKVDNLVRLGCIKLRQGTFAEAETIFQEALTLARSPIQFKRGQAYSLSCLGELYQRQESYERALEVTEEALALAREAVDQYLADDALCNLAMIYLSMGDTATAMILISEAGVQTAGDEPMGYEQAIRNLVAGAIHLSQREYEQAWHYLSKSEATLSRAGLKQEHLQALLRLAAYHLAQGQMSDVIQRMKAAEAIIPICSGYEQLARMEVGHLPDLQQAIETLPDLAHVRALLHLDRGQQAVSSPGPLPTQEKQSQPPAPLALPVLSHEVEGLAHTLTIRSLGEPSVHLHQEPITRWRMARAMELFFYLLDCGVPMRKEAIISALWPEMDEQTTRTFYSTIYYLRQALGGESVIVAKGGTYGLRLDALYGKEVWYDVAVFKDYQTQAKQALDDEQDEEARTGYLAMVDLYRGDYVQPFYSDWCTLRRDELRSAYLDARQQLALITWRAEELDESIVHWQHMLAVDNWLEEAHYGLMRCYARQGKRGLALRQYQRCKDILEQEFGVAPKASTQNFYQRLMGSL